MVQNKKGFLARDWVVAFMVFVAICGIAYLMVNSMAVEYNNTNILDPTFNSSYNKYSELSEDVNDMFQEVNSEEGLSLVGTAVFMFESTFTVIQIIFGTLLLPGAMLKKFALDLGVPGAISNILFTLPLVIITIIIVLVIISSVNQRKM